MPTDAPLALYCDRNFGTRHNVPGVANDYEVARRLVGLGLGRAYFVYAGEANEWAKEGEAREAMLARIVAQAPDIIIFDHDEDADGPWIVTTDTPAEERRARWARTAELIGSVRAAVGTRPLFGHWNKTPCILGHRPLGMGSFPDYEHDYLTIVLAAGLQVAPTGYYGPAVLGLGEEMDYGIAGARAYGLEWLPVYNPHDTPRPDLSAKIAMSIAKGARRGIVWSDVFPVDPVVDDTLAFIADYNPPPPPPPPVSIPDPTPPPPVVAVPDPAPAPPPVPVPTPEPTPDPLAPERAAVAACVSNLDAAHGAADELMSGLTGRINELVELRETLVTAITRRH